MPLWIVWLVDLLLVQPSDGQSAGSRCPEGQGGSRCLQIPELSAGDALLSVPKLFSLLPAACPFQQSRCGSTWGPL